MIEGIIDVHCHVLPQLDDGSASVEESLAMLQMESDQKIGCVIATPHFYAQYDLPEEFLSKRDKAEQALREKMGSDSGLPQLCVGAEVYYYPGISNSEILREFAIRGTNYVLIEMPAPPWTNQMYRELADVKAKQGLTPIIVHIDRYISSFRTFHIPQRLQEMPVLVQANADFFLRKHTSRMALRMLRNNQIHLLGSDSHNMRSRMPNLGEAVALIHRQLGADVLERIVSYQDDILTEAREL